LYTITAGLLLVVQLDISTIKQVLHVANHAYWMFGRQTTFQNNTCLIVLMSNWTARSRPAVIVYHWAVFKIMSM